MDRERTIKANGMSSTVPHKEVCRCLPQAQSTTDSISKMPNSISNPILPLVHLYLE